MIRASTTGKLKSSTLLLGTMAACLKSALFLLYFLNTGIDIQLETGEYFLNDKKKSAKKWQEKQEKQTEKSAESKRKRNEAFIPPQEPSSQSTLNEKNDVSELAESLKKKSKESKKRKTAEKINPEAYIAVS